MTPQELEQKVARVLAGKDPDRLTYWHNGECVEPWGLAWERMLPEARAAIAIVVEEALREIADQLAGYMSEEYATPQPVGSLTERLVCRELSSRIRAMIPEQKP